LSLARKICEHKNSVISQPKNIELDCVLKMLQQIIYPVVSAFHEILLDRQGMLDVSIVDLVRGQKLQFSVEL
jgi:hypothetical protein